MSGLHQGKTPHLKGSRSTGCTPKCQEQEMRAFYEQTWPENKPFCDDDGNIYHNS
jgi:hypothetical protein